MKLKKIQTSFKKFINSRLLCVFWKGLLIMTAPCALQSMLVLLWFSQVFCYVNNGINPIFSKGIQWQNLWNHFTQPAWCPVANSRLVTKNWEESRVNHFCLPCHFLFSNNNIPLFKFVTSHTWLHNSFNWQLADKHFLNKESLLYLLTIITVG